MLLSLPLALMATVTSAAVVPLPPQPLAAVALELNPRNPSLTDRPMPFLPRHGDDEHNEPSHSEGMASEKHPPSASSTGDDLILEPLPSSTHGHSHHHGATPPLMVLNETDILLTHQPNPLSYWTHDYVLEPGDDRLGGRGQWGGWIIWGHAVGMTVALVLLFPLGEYNASCLRCGLTMWREDGEAAMSGRGLTCSYVYPLSFSRSNRHCSPRSSNYSIFDSYPPDRRTLDVNRSPVLDRLQRPHAGPVRTRLARPSRMGPRRPLHGLRRI